MTLSILICTLPERFEKLKRLQNILLPQVERYKDQVSVHYHDAGRALPTGTKRNQLVEQSQSDYFVFIDDDDIVSSFYIDEIVKAMAHNPDVITFHGWMTTNGNNRANFTIKLGSEYTERSGHYYRFPNHLCPMKRANVNMIKFPDVWEREDYIWAKQINDKRLLKSEVHINADIYHYDFTTNKPSYKKVRR
jgi:glycosyltransferase involved in cell wall biosynthesis